jgi:hypothetical protein
LNRNSTLFQYPQTEDYSTMADGTGIPKTPRVGLSSGGSMWQSDRGVRFNDVTDFAGS